jgi:hypothetical protein
MKSAMSSRLEVFAPDATARSVDLAHTLDAVRLLSCFDTVGDANAGNRPRGLSCSP